VCVAVYLATAVGRVQLLFPVLRPLSPGLVSAVLAMGLYVLGQSGLRGVGLLRTRATICIAALTVWMALSVPGALVPGAAFRFLMDNFGKTALMYVVIAGCVRGLRDVERLAFVYFASAVTHALVVLARFQVNATNWRLGGLYDYDANDLATLVVSAMPIGLYFAIGKITLPLRALAMSGLGVLAVAVVRSGSRGAFLALLGMGSFVLFRVTTVHARWRLAGVIVIVVLFTATASERYWSEMQTILNPTADYNETSEGGRLKVWGRGLVYMKDHPLLGVGANNFDVAEGTISPLAKVQQYGTDVRWAAAHNSFVQVGAELGVPGLCFFIALLAATFASLRRVVKHSGRTAGGAAGSPRLAQTLMAALVGFLVGAFFLSLAYADMLYTLIALAIGLEKVTRFGGASLAWAPGRGRASSWPR
jgi:O-antigen ligase